MSYELYTWPHCEDCDRVKELLDVRKIGYTSVEVFDNTEGKRRLRDAEVKIGDKRVEPFKLKISLHGKIIFPILVQRNGDGVERLVQGYDNIKALL